MVKTLKTGDVVRVKRASTLFDADNWVLVNQTSRRAVWASITRHGVRAFKYPVHRIAKIISRAPKTLLVEISK
jgi:hypothetical protein